ncbi:MAG: HAD family hydrolase [Deltaproteobacteria bacterium]|nr:HAD family hydrolase [Deltaproteobacteria bacterium]
MIRAVVFDMDDTLYPEAQYVRSGFRAVGRELETRGAGPAARASELFASIHFGEGRDRVFNKAAERLGFPEEWVRDLIDVYREHVPDGLSLHEDAVDVLAALRGSYKLGVVTDGWTVVQQHKVDALGVAAEVDHVFLTDHLGRSMWKPHPEPFRRCLAALDVHDPAEAVFVGDNPERDVEGAYNAGMVPVLIRRDDAYFGAAQSAREPMATIRTLAELPALLARLSENA